VTSDEIVTTIFFHVTTDIVILLKALLLAGKRYYSRNLLIINTVGERRNKREDVIPLIDMRGITPQNQHHPLQNQGLRWLLLVTYLKLLGEIPDQRG
jgi:hypothetical protein